MTVPVVAFFNNKGGVGKTSLVYHLAWMYADMGINVVASDLDPQANLTAMFLEEERLEHLWESERTVYGWLRPLLRGVGDISDPDPERIEDGPSLLVGDLRLSEFEEELSSQWPNALSGNERAFRVLSAFWRLMQKAAQLCEASLVLMDLGPNLGAINRASLISADYVVIPLSPDLFSLQGLRNLGPTFRRWRRDWKDRLDRKPGVQLELPEGRMEPIGYVVMQHGVRLDRPVKAYEKWIARIPEEYSRQVIEQSPPDHVTVDNDANRLALLKHYRSLMPLAQEARKPIFHLKPADGAIGSHAVAAANVHRDFKQLALAIAERTAIPLPSGIR